MSSSDTILLYAPAESEFEIKGMLPSDKLKKLASSTAEVSVEALQAGLNQTLSALLEMLNRCTVEVGQFHVSEVALELGIDASGKAALWPFSAEIASAASIRVTLARKAR